jgi:aminopeptidase N
MRLRGVLLGCCIFCSVYACADSYVRQASIDALHYDIAIQVTDGSSLITAATRIDIRIRNKSASGMWLDLEDLPVDKLRVGGKDCPFTAGNGRLTFDFDRTYSPGEIVRIEVQYHGQPRDGLLFVRNKYGRAVVFADNWPNRAHYWFPSIDHPSDKATISFAITAPQKYQVIATGRMERTTLLPDGQQLTIWTEAKAIPTYCMVFGVAEFSVQRSVTGTVPLAWYAYPQDSGFTDQGFVRTSAVLGYFQTLIAPYPYEKLSQVESVIRTGAMENSGTIFYSEALIRDAPIPQETLAHEIAHQWFGDSVTESDWDDLWLSEGFATYLEALFYEQVNGKEAFKSKMARHAEKIAAYTPSRTTPIVDPIQTDPWKKLTPLNYEKGAWVLHMLRGMMGDEIFLKAVRRFYNSFEGGNASTGDFEKVMESVSGIDLSGFFRQWLFQPGMPEYRVSWQWIDSAGELEIKVSQLQNGHLFDMPVEIQVSAGQRKRVFKFRAPAASNTFRILLEERPASVELDPDNWILKK